MDTPLLQQLLAYLPALGAVVVSILLVMRRVRSYSVLMLIGSILSFVIGIAGAGNDHLELLGKIAEVFLDESQIANLEQASSPAQVRDAFGKVNG